jgi:hypothetical protein
VRARGALVVAAALLTAAASTPANAGASCITRLPVRASLPNPYASSYRDVLPVRIETKGPTIRFLRVELYSFAGEKLGEGRRGGPLRASAKVRVRLRFPMQVGSFTLVVTGEPNRDRSCGPKQLFKVLRFRDCPSVLPVSFPSPPGGAAADYQDYLSVKVTTSGGLLRDLLGTVATVAGETIGDGRLSVLFGTATLDMRLTRRLVRGDYRVTVQGHLDKANACPPAQNRLALRFT